MSKKFRILSFFLALTMLFSSARVVPAYAQEDTAVSGLTTPFRNDVVFTVDGNFFVTSNSYRIPAMVTLDDGTIVAAADIRWNNTYDGGCLDTLVARSEDGGATWQYTVANYLGDNGNEYNSQSTAFIDSCLTVGADGKTVYLLCDLYPYGIALNGNGSQKAPSTDIGFTKNGYLMLRDSSHTSYDYYLKEGSIYDSSDTQVPGYCVDEYYNLYDESNDKISNLFFENSPFKVVRTGFLYLISSTDGGTTWSAPKLLNLKTSSEQVCLVAPGNGITTSNGTMVFPVYSHNGNGNQQLGFVYSNDGVDWYRSTNFTGAAWSSESAVVEVGEGTLRFFYRNGTSNLCYVDYYMTTNTWGSCVETDVKTNSNTQLSAITYSKTFNGNQVILVSCPTGPNEAGSNNNDGSFRTNGKIFVGVVDTEFGTMSWPKSIDVGPYKATARLEGSNYTEEQGFFAYSCLTERSDGSIAILYENNQFGWGASGSNGNGTYAPEKVTTYYTITGKAYSKDDLGLPFDDEKIIDRTATIRDGVTSVTLYATPSENDDANVSVAVDVLPEIMAISGMYYDNASGTIFYQVRAAVGFTWPEEYNSYFYIPAESIDLRTDYGIAIPIVDFTNAAPLVSRSSIPQPATYMLRSSARTLSLSKAASNSSSGLVLDKTVTDNSNGTYTVNLEAYTTGTVTVQQTTKPMDIVLVLDQSGSMAYCIGCGSDNENVSSGEYHATYDVSTDGIYYRRPYGNYSRLYYCSTCSGWHTSQNHSGTKYTPKSSDDDWGNTQFYVECESRLDALKRAVQSFVDEVYKKAAGADGVNGTTDDIAHRIAIVGFASESGYGNNTELLSISGNNSGTVGITYNSITTANYTNVLQNLAVSGSKTMLDNAINALAASGATEADLGMLMAENIFKNNTVDLAQRDRVTIMFTDGTPTTGNTYSSTVANNAINTSYSLKNTYGSTVYTVGVFDGADASSPGTLPTGSSGSNRENRYMHLVSSNYLSATDTNNTGSLNPTVTGDDSYYLSASDSTALNDIFQAMSSQIGSTSMDLGSETVIKDIVTPQFDLPEGVNSVTVKQVDCISYNEDTGVAAWGTETALSSVDTVQIDPYTNSVSVTGFDFKHNYVAKNGRNEDDETKEGTFHGRKLVITFVITPDPDFLGGDNVETNGTESGVYDKNGTCVGKFVNPKVDVPLKAIDTVAQDKHIYYGNTTDLTGILNLKVAESNSGKYLQDIANGINNAYVNLVYTITLNDKTVVTYTIPAGVQWDKGTWKNADGTAADMSKLSLDEDTAYGIKCTMFSLSDSYNSKEAQGTATVYVYKPVLTFADSKVYYQEAIDFDENYKSTVWKNGTTIAGSQMEGSEPALVLTYNYVPGSIDESGNAAVKHDIPVSVTVTADQEDITNVVSFQHNDCNHPGCGFDSSTAKFIVHVLLKETSMTIIKKFPKDADYSIDVYQTFIFDIKGVDGTVTADIDLTVTVHGDGEITITNLPIGDYEVTEQTDWSWRYEPEGGSSKNITLSPTEENTITFENKRSEEKWLDGDSYNVNIFTGKAN